MQVDNISWNIINALQDDGRISLKDLASKVNLSLPATSERVKRLEEAGVITGYRALVNYQALGHNVMAIITMTAFKPAKAKLVAMLEEMPEVLECLHITGESSYLLRVVATDMLHLEQTINTINHLGETNTSIVMSEPIPLRKMSKPSTGTI